MNTLRQSSNDNAVQKIEPFTTVFLLRGDISKKLKALAYDCIDCRFQDNFDNAVFVLYAIRGKSFQSVLTIVWDLLFGC